MLDIEGFRAHLTAAELSENTIRVYVTALRQYAEQYETVTPSGLRGFKQRTGWTAATLNLKLSAIRRYCAWKGIAVPVKLVKVQRLASVENVITAEELHQLLDGLSADGNERWRVNVLLLARTGARISEAVRITKADVLRGSVDMPTKGKIRRIYIPSRLAEDIAPYLETLRPQQTVMLNKDGAPITPQGVGRMLARLAARYGIPRSHMHPHAFRHLFAIEFLRRKNDITLLADILGHSSVNVTMIYLRRSQEEQKREIDSVVDW